MDKYIDIKELSEVAYNFISNCDFFRLELGKHELGNGVYVNVEEYNTKFRCDAKFEAHKKFVDVQFMIEGEEIITIAPVDSLQVVEAYSSEKDIIFFSNKDIRGIDYRLESGKYLVLYPKDAHMPCICLNAIATVKKAVIKIPYGGIADEN